jgi:hypothetical protein
MLMSHACFLNFQEGNEEKHISLNLNSDFLVLYFENFLVTAFSLDSSTQIIQCFRAILIGSTSMNPIFQQDPLHSLSMMKDKISLQQHFYGVIYKMFLLKKDLV